jgi:hypothetical protein
MMLQEFYFTEALKEIHKLSSSSIVYIDHHNGKCFINNEKFDLIFPKYMIELIYALSKTKNIDFFFQGLINSKRKWILDFTLKSKSFILNSYYGRNSETKYILDIEYYKKMSSSNFTLCPEGDCPWTYRFFEAIMCFSIPILKNSNDIFCSEYHYFILGDNYEYSYDKALENYNKFILRHTFQVDLSDN